jgi:hypothetical protein
MIAELCPESWEDEVGCEPETRIQPHRCTVPMVIEDPVDFVYEHIEVVP